MLQMHCTVLTMMQYVHCLRNINYQSTAICRQIIRVDIEVEYFCDNIFYHHRTTVCIFLYMQCSKSSVELVRKYGRLSSIPFLKSSVPFHSGIFHIPHRNFHFILFHFIPCPVCRFYIINIIVIFYSNGCSQVENPEAPDFEKIASVSSSFSTLSLPSSPPLPISFIKVLPLPQELTASTASASTSLI